MMTLGDNSQIVTMAQPPADEVTGDNNPIGVVTVSPVTREAAKKRGYDHFAPKWHHIAARVSREEFREIQLYLAATGESLSDLVRRSIFERTGRFFDLGYIHAQIDESACCVLSVSSPGTDVEKC
jgi:hypothetical protein